MQSIKDKAIADGTFMKAPNGNPTNLNERQWLQVRTKNFINWFGDWINNPKEASKVVDENGEPLVVYRGDFNNKTVFFPKSATYNVFGIYIAGNIKMAENYAKKSNTKVYEIFVNSRNPFTENNLKEEGIQNMRTASELWHKNGKLSQYDGWIYGTFPNGNGELVVDNPNQIKSATDNNGEFSTTNDDIHYSSVDEVSNDDYTPEMNSIKEKAISNNTFMKAPNGKPTNLNERQWLQVRTKNFINWFGDWINNPSNASKVVDENGEPLVVYHASPEYNITVFRNTDSISFTKYPNETTEEAINRYKELGYEISSEQIDNIRKNNYDIFENPIILTKPNAIYAASNRKVSETYITRESFEEGLYLDGEVYPVFLNIKDNNIIEGNNSNWNEIQYKGKTVSTRKLESEFRGIKDGVIIKNIFDFGSPVMDTHKTNLSDIFIVYNPNQVKSATSNNGEVSTTNDDIHYSSVDEVSITAPSIQSLQERLPVDQQPKFAQMVASADIETSCR